jgi:hypothetical protein
LTVNVCPAIVSVPLRADPVFAATLTPTEPLPVPAAPDVIESQDALLAAVHAQALPVVTATEPVFAFALTFWLCGEIE